MSTNIDDENIKIPLPQFLKILTGNNLPMQKAIAVAAKVFAGRHPICTKQVLTQLQIQRIQHPSYAWTTQ
jgi:hypothetical protein